MTIYFLLYGRYPFEHDENNHIVDKISIIKGKYSYPHDKEYSKEAKDLIDHLLIFSPEDRFTAKQALSHPWFSEFQRSN